MRVHKLIQALYWLLHKKDAMECLFTSMEDKKICQSCKHNEWRES